MQLFVCHQCQCVDCIDLAFHQGLPSAPEQQRCTKCKTGTWHNRFEYTLYNPYTDLVVNRPTGHSVG